MTEYPAIFHPDLCPAHPGELLRDDVIPAVKRPKAEIARLLGISRQHLYGILDETRPVTADMAVRLAKMFGGSAGLWVRMQANYDAWHAERKVDTKSIPRLEAVADTRAGR